MEDREEGARAETGAAASEERELVEARLPGVRARYEVPKGALLGGHPTWLRHGAEIFRVEAEALVPEDELAARLERELRRAEGEDVRIHGGRGLILSIGDGARERNVRLTRDRREQIRVRGKALWVAALDDGREVWIVGRETEAPRQRVALVDGSQVTYPDMPSPAGPSVPGLNPAVAASCAAPSAHRVASRGDRAVVLVVECHRDAPIRILALEGQTWLTRTLPPLGFGPEALALHPDGRVVVAGSSPGRVASEQPNGSWEVSVLPTGTATVTAMALGADGSPWIHAVVEGHGATLVHDGEIVRASSPDGEPLTVWELVDDAALGPVALGSAGPGSDQAWLLTLP